jgi:hypothetical protein
MIILRKIAPPSNQEIYRSGTVVADTISGTLNGSNQTFYTTFNYRKDHITMYYNGQALHPDYDFEQTGDNEITFNFVSPLPNENLRATYELEAVSYDPSQRGRVSIPLGAVSKSIIFPTSLSDTNYNISIDLVSSDADPSVYSWIIAQKSVSGFTVFFSGEIDSNNYVLEWEVFR